LALPGEGFRDFMISGPTDHGIHGLINLYGIESPGLTACLALAARVTSTARP
jgi:L-2-hydroxyglutarate oxidase LhgO